MDDNYDLKAGEKIEIEIEEENGVGQYKSKVEEIIDEKTILISRPIGMGRYAYITEGQILRIVYCRKNTAYYFNARVVERLRSNDTVIVKLQIISERLKLQRRNFFRLNIVVPITVDIVEYQQGSIKRTRRSFYTSDISGGGIKLISDEKIDTGSELEIYMDIPGIKNELIKGKVVRSAMSSKIKDAYDIGIEFIDIQNTVRQAIIQYIFTRQRELLRKGIRME